MPANDAASSGLKVVFAGTPEFAAVALRALLSDGIATVSAVYSQPDRPGGRGRRLLASPVKQLAQLHSLPVYQPQNFRSPAALDELRALQPDVFVVAAYGLLLPKSVLEIPRRSCINIHASLLPRWRGAAPIERAIEAGDQQTGISIMQMDEGLDTGPILAQQSCPITPTETGDSLRDKLAAIGAASLLHSLRKLIKGELEPQEQDDNHASYAGKISKQELQIDWRLTATELERKVRAFTAANTMFTIAKDMRIKVGRVEVSAATGGHEPGSIIELQRDAIVVACANGALRIVQLQLPGGKMLPAQALLNAKKSLFETASVFGIPA